MKKIPLLIVATACVFAVFGFIQEPAKQQQTAKKQTSAKPAVGTSIGNQAPELSFLNPEGKTITLSSLKGKLVLVDFWASWCKPCRFENPNVVSAYTKYKSAKFKNGNSFTVLGVSLDMNKDQWVAAIMQDKLTWDHMSDLGGWNSAPAAAYGVRAIPTNFLVDGKGIIVAVNLRGPALGAELEKYLVR
jgi:thiol-disulfide isomerase/thioredoxin